MPDGASIILNASVVGSKGLSSNSVYSATKCLSKNIFTYTANFQDVVRYGAMTVLGLNEAE
jgi:NADP-dependent 3-hydroxy acid dehydrogenase YdfG